MNNEKATLDFLKNQWRSFIDKNTEFEIIADNDIQVLTSFIDYFGDGIIFDILEVGENNFTLTDKGYTLWNMAINNIDLSKKHTTRFQLLQWYLKSFNFIVEDKVIKKEKVTKAMLSQSIMDFIQLLLRISDLAMTNRANTRGIFFEDAQQYFNDQRNIFYFSTNNIAVGQTEQQYRFEYNFTPKLGVNKFTKLYNTLSKNSMEALIGIYTDTSQFFSDNYRDATFNVLVNEIDNFSQKYIDGLKQHNIEVIDFQNKDQVISKFGIAS